MTLRKNLTLGAVVLGFATILVIEWAGVDIINLFKVLTDGSDSHTPLSQQVISTNSVVFEMDSLPLQPAEMSMSELAAPPVGKNLKTVSGRVGKAVKFNGKDSFLSTSLLLTNADKVDISLWVRPSALTKVVGIEVLLDTGHSDTDGFVVQTSVVDGSREDWVLFCNGTSVHFRLALGRWNLLRVVLDTKENTISVSVNELVIKSSATSRECNFGSSPLTVGSHADINSRVFRGDVDRLIVLRN